MSGPFYPLLTLPIARVRALVLAKFLLLLLALDCAIDLIPHGGRYGVGGFNVAHFRFLDAALPVPTPSLYVGALLCVSVLALVLVVGRLRRSLLVVLTLVYTLSWASSLLDAYQHHYLISLLLVSMCTFRMDTFEQALGDAEGGKNGLLPAPGYISFIVTCATVYLFAALMKLDADWRDGSALRRIVDTTQLDGVFIRFAFLGLSEDGWYRLLARGAVGLQLAIGAGLLASLTAERRGWLGRLLIGLCVLAPLAFHASAEAMSLEIGWFTRYMVGIAIIAFAPREGLETVVGIVEWMRRSLRRLVGADDTENDSPFARGVVAALALAFGVLAMSRLDLPGSTAAGVVCAVLLTACYGFERRGAAESGSDLPVAFVLATGVVFASIAHPAIGLESDRGFIGLDASTVRFDYYRFVGGDRRRRLDVEGAIAAYRKSYAYAPTEDERESTAAKLRALSSQRVAPSEARTRSDGARHR